MVTSLSVEWPHTVSLLGFPKIRNQILNLICNRFCGSELLIREATDVGMFLFGIACLFGMRIPCVKLLVFSLIGCGFGFSFPGAGFLACRVFRFWFLTLVKGSCFGAAPCFRSDTRFLCWGIMMLFATDLAF